MSKPNLHAEDRLGRLLSKVGDMSFRRRVLTVCEYLDPAPGDLILDAGCGEGFISIVLENVYGCRVVGLDSDREILSQGVSRDKGGAGNSWLIGDVTKLPFNDAVFDGVVCSEVLEHLDDDLAALCELGRVLKPCGALAVTVPCLNYPGLWDPLNRVRESLGLGHFSSESGFWGGLWTFHIRLYTLEELRAVVTRSDAFEIDLVEGLTRYCLPFNHVVLWTLKQMYMRLPATGAIHRSMEKFEYDDSGGSSLPARLASFGLRACLAIDAWNDRDQDPEKPCVSLALRAVKHAS